MHTRPTFQFILRPEQITNRSELDHWEGDSVIGKNHQEGIRTEVERVSRYMQAVKLERVTAHATVDAQKNIFLPLPVQARQSTTLDNGREHMQHIQLNLLGIATYFADPYSSWQRGTNEYHNGLLRRYLPKGTSFKELTQEDLDDMIWEINNRPRKALAFSTPQEVFTHYLLSVRIQTRM